MSIESGTNTTGQLVDNADNLDNASKEKVLAEALNNQNTSLTIQSHHFSGPLPPPEYLQEYDKIAPGFAKRVLTMSEKEQRHRHKLESNAIQASISSEQVGQRYAFMLCAFMVAGSITLIALHHDLAGSLFGGTSVVGLAYVFISGRHKNQEKSNGKD